LGQFWGGDENVGIQSQNCTSGGKLLAYTSTISKAMEEWMIFPESTYQWHAKYYSVYYGHQEIGTRE